MSKIDKTLIGVLLGLVMPAITSVAFYKLAYHGSKDFWGFIDGLLFLDSVATLLAVCSLPNLAIFMILANLNKMKISRGLFLSTLIYAFAVIVFKFGIQ